MPSNSPSLQSDSVVTAPSSGRRVRFQQEFFASPQGGCRPPLEATVLTILFACTVWAVVLVIQQPPADDEETRAPSVLDKGLLGLMMFATLAAWAVAVRRILGRWCTSMFGGCEPIPPPASRSRGRRSLRGSPLAKATPGPHVAQLGTLEEDPEEAPCNRSRAGTVTSCGVGTVAPAMPLR